MDDLTRCLYEFLMETRMGRIWEDEEYKACNSGLLLQEQRVRSRLSGEQEAELDRFLDNAVMGRLQEVRIIHGKGTGAVRAAVRDHLKRSRYVKTFRPGRYGEGEDGVTIAELK